MNTPMPIERRLPMIRITFSLLTLSLITACGGGSGGGEAEPPPSKPTHTELKLDFVQTKTFRFTWTDVADTTHSRIMENPDGISGFTQVGDDIPPGIETYDHTVALYDRIDSQYLLQGCNSNGCTDLDYVSVSGALTTAIGYIKASNTNRLDRFGYAVSVSEDGSTLAVGAPYEASDLLGVGASLVEQRDNSANRAGAVYVFTRENGSWSQHAFVKASNAEAGDSFGHSVSLSKDGSTLAVGAPNEEGASPGVNNDQADNSAGTGAGAVYVFTRNSGVWAQQAYVKSSNPSGYHKSSYDNFGRSIDLSDDGNTLAVGAPGESSNATGIDGDQQDDSSDGSGAVYVFTRSAGVWSQQAYVKASNTPSGAFTNDAFGIAVSLSSGGDILAVGAPGENSNATGINGNQADTSANEAGAVYVFTRGVGGWSQQAYVKASNTFHGFQFGRAVSLSSDGTTLAVGSPGEASNATGINGSQGFVDFGNGAVYVFSKSTDFWKQQAYIKSSNTPGTQDGNYEPQFGFSVSLSGDGSTLAVGAHGEGSAATGLNGDQDDISAHYAGATYVFRRDADRWSQQSYVKASNTGQDLARNDQFGFAVDLSDDGHTLAVGAFSEDGATVGVNGDQSDRSRDDAGAVYLY